MGNKNNPPIKEHSSTAFIVTKKSSKAVGIARMLIADQERRKLEKKSRRNTLMYNMIKPGVFRMASFPERCERGRKKMKKEEKSHQGVIAEASSTVAMMTLVDAVCVLASRRADCPVAIGSSQVSWLLLFLECVLSGQIRTVVISASLAFCSRNRLPAYGCSLSTAGTSDLS